MLKDNAFISLAILSFMVDFSKIKTIPLSQRYNKVTLNDIIPLENDIPVLENKDLRELAGRVVDAYKAKKQIIVTIGAHTIKVGLSLILIDLMKKGIIKHLAMNGATTVHDFEISYQGATSEDVAKNIEDGTFGMADETGYFLNKAMKEGADANIGCGKAIGKKIVESDLRFVDYSILAAAYKHNVPATVHIAIGTDIIHQHPSCSGVAIGKTSYEDFKIFTDSVSKLEGGVLINIGSSVILPEVFIKSLSIVRNLGYNVRNITTANLDMIKHYRPHVNIVVRPTSLGGKGYHIIEKHEKTVPSLHKMIIEMYNSVISSHFSSI